MVRPMAVGQHSASPSVECSLGTLLLHARCSPLRLAAKSSSGISESARVDTVCKVYFAT
jgi:hypothetical protein